MDGLERKRNPPAMDIGLFRRCDGRVGAALARHRLRRDRSGATAVIVALSAPILLAMAGLGVDAGFWYTIKRQNQSAADAAAISAAYEVAYATGNQLAAATQAATANGWVNNTNPPAGLTPIQVYYPCTSSTCTFAAGGIQVVLQQQQPTWFANFASLANVTITNSAVAVVSNLPPACMLLMGRNPPPSGSGNAGDALSLAGGPTISAPNCTIVSDFESSSAVKLQGAASITAATLITAGQISHTGAAYTLDLSHPAEIGADPVSDPYASTLTHTALVANMPTTGACSYNKTTHVWSGSPCVIPGSSINSGDTLPSDIQITGGLSLKGGTTNLSPGTYWITGGDLTLGPGGGGTILSCSACSSGGAGVTIIFTTAGSTTAAIGAVQLNSLASLDLNAPAPGSSPTPLFPGMVLIQELRTACRPARRGTRSPPARTPARR